MEEIIEKTRKQVIERYGRRLDGRKCALCGTFLNVGDYCSCKQSQRINRYFKKTQEVLRSYEYCLQNEIRINCKTPTRFEGMTFDDYKVESESERKGLDAVLEYYNQGLMTYVSGMNLLLLGNFGTGKSMLMSILCNALAEKYFVYAGYVNAVDLIYQITDTFNAKKDKNPQTIIKKYQTQDYLFLDDIDKVKVSEYVREVFYNLINYRTENELPTIISANSSLEELDSKFYGEAIISRLIQNSRVVNFTHKNRRFEA